MGISADMLALARRLCDTLEPPAITGLHLPELPADDEYRDEFGFVFLADGTAAPFYVSLPGTLAALHARFPDPARVRLPLPEWLEFLAAESLPERSLAIGAWNALGQHLFRRAGFICPRRGAATGHAPQTGERIGMVGYFCPVIDRLVADGVEVLVVEQQPGRVPRREGVVLSQDPASLEGCRLVYCTASTLINDSLEQVLSHCAAAEAVDLIGPTGSGLPDVVFSNGIHAVGGVGFDDAQALREALARRESWGSAGRKYELTADSYPGVEALLVAAREAL